MDMRIHVVQKGETLWAISRQYGISINTIIQANQLPDPNVLVVGQALVIPIADRIHIVQSGDSLWRIARLYGVTIQEIINANRLADPNRLSIGQQLMIPAKTRTYIVQSGDILWKIAQRLGTTVEEVMKDNRITNPNKLYPGQTLQIRKPLFEVNGYFTNLGASGQQVLQNVGEYLTYMSTFSYKITTDGNMIPLDDTAILAIAKSEQVAPLLTLTNFGQRTFSSNLAHTLLTNPTLQDTLITNIINTLRSKGYRGINIDFEYVLPEDRENYNQFLRLVVDRLHPEGFLVSTALAPKIIADQIGLLYEAHDYPAHGQIVDFVVLMTYEWGWAGGAPMAIAPINEVRRVLDYAVTAIPRNRILMGVPMYGRDWKLPYERGKTIAATFGPQEAIRRAAKYGADIQYDITGQSPFFRYVDEQGNNHEVWFEDARSIQAKYETVKEYRLRGVSYWEMSTSFPQNWYVLADEARIKKL